MKWTGNYRLKDFCASPVTKTILAISTIIISLFMVCQIWRGTNLTRESVEVIKDDFEYTFRPNVYAKEIRRAIEGDEKKHELIFWNSGKTNACDAMIKVGVAAMHLKKQDSDKSRIREMLYKHSFPQHITLYPETPVHFDIQLKREPLWEEEFLAMYIHISYRGPKVVEKENYSYYQAYFVAEPRKDLWTIDFDSSKYEDFFFSSSPN